MDPTPQSAPAPVPPPSQPVVEYFRTNRPNGAFILIGFSVLFLIAAGWLALKAARTPAEAPKEKEKTKQEKMDLDSLDLEGKAAKVTDPNQGDFTRGAVAAAAVFIFLAAGGAWLLFQPPAPGEAQQRTEIRTILLIVGGLVGVTFMLIGVAFFYSWAGSLTDWLEKGDAKQARWVLIPLLMTVLGAGLAFAAVQPARAEERNNSALRKLVYSANLGLSVLLLIVVLVTANVALGRRVPNKLDTTADGFYSLTHASEEFLAGLKQPVTAYAILSGRSQTAEDTRRLLQTCADVPGTSFKVKFISPTSDKGEYSKLKGAYPVLEVNDFGVLLTYGTDEKRHSFIREEDFGQRDTNPMPGGPPPARSFVGESRLLQEILFLSENQEKAVIYFTQSSGELDLTEGRGDEEAATGSITRLKAFLERHYVEVRPLKFELTNPKVPDDAAVVVVADPRTPISEPVAAALRRYMTQPRGDKKGKLIVLAGAQFGPDNKILRTGLEDLLGEFNIRLGDRVLYGEPTRELPPTVSYAVFARSAVTARNPVVAALGDKAAFIGRSWRPVGATTPAGAPPTPAAFRPIPLLITVPGRPTWLESERVTDLDRVLSELNDRPELRAAKQLTENPRAVGVAASEGDIGRVVVVGNGFMVSDELARGAGGDLSSFELISATIDWLRDRPALGFGVEAKKHKEFTFPLVTDEMRGLWLPLLVSLLVVCGAGRRRLDHPPQITGTPASSTWANPPHPVPLDCGADLSPAGAVLKSCQPEVGSGPPQRAAPTREMPTSCRGRPLWRPGTKSEGFRQSTR